MQIPVQQNSDGSDLCRPSLLLTQTGWHSDASPLFDLALIHRDSVSLTCTVTQQGTDRVVIREFKRVLQRCLHKTPSSPQPIYQCASRIRVAPSSTRVMSLRCGQDGSSSSESSEEVRTTDSRNLTLPFAFPFPVLKTTAHSNINYEVSLLWLCQSVDFKLTEVHTITEYKMKLCYPDVPHLCDACYWHQDFWFLRRSQDTSSHLEPKVNMI